MATKLSLTGITFPDTTVQTTAASGGGLGGMQVFTSSGTFTVPAGKTVVKVTMVGAGGSGRFGDSGTGGGGGSGGYAEGYVTGLTPGGTVAVTVGAGANNSNGGTTSFGSYISITGGTTGSAAYAGAGGAGGVCTGGTLQFSGNTGGSGFDNGCYNGPGYGAYGVSPYQSGFQFGTNGSPASGYGAGGNGGTNSNAGSGGRIIVEY